MEPFRVRLPVRKEARGLITRAMNDTGLAKRRQQLSPTKQALLEARLKRAQAQEAPAATIPPRPDPSKAPLSIAQEALWAIHQIEPENPAYNRPFALRLSGRLNLSAMESAIGALGAASRSARRVPQCWRPSAPGVRAAPPFYAFTDQPGISAQAARRSPSKVLG